jgi:hypothetical protein
MRTIGRVELRVNSDGMTEDAEYVDGLIIELTRREAYILKLLQDSCAGNSWTIDTIMNDYHSKPEDANMEALFGLVYAFTQARFAINDFKKIVNHLEETIIRLDRKDE